MGADAVYIGGPLPFDTSPVTAFNMFISLDDATHEYIVSVEEPTSAE